MKTALQTLFCFLILFSCSKKKAEKSKPTLLKIGYYPTFHQSAEAILNLDEKFLIFYSPTSYNPPPPSPQNGTKYSNEEEKEYEKYLSERPKLEPFESKINEKEINEIIEGINLLTSDDLNMSDIKPPNDGMFINIVIRYSNGKIDEINPMNAPKENHRILYRKVLDLIINKNSNRNDSIILQEIKKYR